MTFAGGLTFALVLGYLAHRLKLSPIVGYLLAGVLVGPFTPGFVADRAVAEQFAEIGVILLLFGIGLRFNLRELAAAWRVAVPSALIQGAIATGVLALPLHWMGWNWTAGIILGMATSVASTVVMSVVLTARHDLHSPIGHIAMGRTVVEDILTVAMLLLLPAVVSPGSGGSGAIGAGRDRSGPGGGGDRQAARDHADGPPPRQTDVHGPAGRGGFRPGGGVQLHPWCGRAPFRADR
jgi:monovalent cation:H+ antiporter-2, CPA2 family